MIELDHVIVSARDRVASARLLAGLLDVPWDETALGIFSAVYVNPGLTLDFISTDEQFPVEHLLLSRQRCRVRRHPGAARASGNRLSRRCARLQRQQHRHRLWRAQCLLGCTRQSPLGNPDEELRAPGPRARLTVFHPARTPILTRS